MSISIDDYDDLTKFVDQFMSHAGRPGETATDHFRGVEIRCEGVLGGRRWTVYGSKTLAFVSNIGWDEVDDVTDRLIRSGLLPIDQY